MPITILDYVRSIVGDKPAYHAEDFTGNGVAMLGGCERCYAMLGGYNAYPSTSGSWRCEGCIGDTGYATAEEFKIATFGPWTCPTCGAGHDIAETRVTAPVGERYSLECGECHEVWEWVP
jgi:hypothetical protein